MATIKYGVNGYVQCAKCGNDATSVNMHHPELCVGCFGDIVASDEAYRAYLTAQGEVERPRPAPYDEPAAQPAARSRATSQE